MWQRNNNNKQITKERTHGCTPKPLLFNKDSSFYTPNSLLLPLLS